MSDRQRAQAIERLACECGHIIGGHDIEPPYRCFAGCRCTGFAASRIVRMEVRPFNLRRVSCHFCPVELGDDGWPVPTPNEATMHTLIFGSWHLTVCRAHFDQIRSEFDALDPDSAKAQGDSSE